ncbi:MAG: rfbB [Candidatus Angelobacter sp.]|jgi:dTDP-glucose 4,6-dehydratase|nr:rfbB [Candidatus Angelobacter sp.]
MRMLIAGGAGFIGSNFVRYMLEQHPGYDVVVVDKLTYAGNLKNLDIVLADQRFSFVRLDICDPAIADVVRGCDLVVNFAAESHVDRSIEDALGFVRSNIEGCWRLLDACRRTGVQRYLQVSTDEVYGSLTASGRFREDTPLSPNSPYSATKAAADLMVQAYVKTYGFPAIVTRCSNNYGPFQFPEKFVPLMIVQAVAGDFLPIYGDGQNVRDWIHVADHCRALDLVLHKGRDGEIYNVGGECEMKNLDVAWRILDLTGRPLSLLRMVKDRPGHDRRYAVDCSKIKEQLNWEPHWDFDHGLVETIRWYRDNGAWLDQVRSGEYREYFDRHYIHRETTLTH